MDWPYSKQVSESLEEEYRNKRYSRIRKRICTMQDIEDFTAAHNKHSLTDMMSFTPHPTNSYHKPGSAPNLTYANAYISSSVPLGIHLNETVMKDISTRVCYFVQGPVQVLHLQQARRDDLK